MFGPVLVAVTIHVFAPGTGPGTSLPLISVPTTPICSGEFYTPGPQPFVFDADAGSVYIAWDNPDRPGTDCRSHDIRSDLNTLPACTTPTCTEFPVYVAFTFEDHTVAWSSDLRSVTRQAKLADDCTPPLGAKAVSVFVTKWEATTGRVGSMARVNFQLGSPGSPVTSLTVRLDGKTVGTPVAGTNLTGVGGIWFQSPSLPGSYLLSLEAANAAGCTSVQAKDATGKAMTVTVK